MSDTEQTENAANDNVLTKQKKPRSPAQIAAFEKARAAQKDKRDQLNKAAGVVDPDIDRKKIILKAVKEKLNGEPAKQPEETEEESDDDPSPPPPPKKVVKKAAPPPTPVKAKKEPKVVYQEESDESEEEVVIVKKKKKPKKKTIIYEESSEEEEEAPPPKKTRETKTQQNSKSVFSIKPSIAQPPKPLYYFAE